MGPRSRTALAVLLVVLLASIASAAGKPIKPSALIPSQPADSTEPAPGPIVRKDHKTRVPNQDKLNHGKADAAHGHGPASGGSGGVAPDAVVAGGLNQPGLGATDNSAANQGTP